MMTVISINRARRAKVVEGDSASDFNWREYNSGVILIYAVEFYGDRLKDINIKELNGFEIGVSRFILRDNSHSHSNIKVEAVKAFAELGYDLPQDFYIGFLNGFGVAYNKLEGW